MRTLCSSGVAVYPWPHLVCLFLQTSQIANKLIIDCFATGSTDKEGKLECKCSGIRPRLPSFECDYFTFALKVWLITLRAGEPRRHAFPPQRISRFNLGFVTLKTAFIFLLYRFFFDLTWLFSTLFPHTVFSLSFFSITPATLVAARHGEIQTAIGWSARLPDRREQGERIGSPMPGNLPDNGMWPFNNIHKYSDEAKWGCPRDCVVQAVSGMRKKKQQQHCCAGVLQGRGQDFFLPCSQSQECGGDIVRFVELCLILNMNHVEHISSFWLGKTNNPLTPRSDVCGQIEALLHLNNWHTLQFPLKVCVRATITMVVASHIWTEKLQLCGSWINPGILITKRLSAG